MKTEHNDIRLASVLFTVIGVGYLFPFSALTQPIDYWHKMFPDFNIEFPLTTLYLWVNLIVLGLIVFRGGEPSYTFRIVGGFIGQFLVLVLVPSLYFFHLSENTNYVFIMIATAFAAIVTSYIDSVAISFAAQYPRKVQESLQIGIGFSTLIGSAYRILTKAVFPPEQVVESSTLYFYCGAVTILSGVGAYYWLLRLPLSARCLKFGLSAKENSRIVSGVVDADTSGLLDDDIGTFSESPVRSTGVVSGGSSVALKSFSAKRNQDDNKLTTSTSETNSLLSKSRSVDMSYGGIETGGNIVHNSETVSVLDKREIFFRVFFGEFLVFLVYCTSLALWPPLVTEIKSFNFPHLQETQWWPLLMLSFFSVCDCIGRIMTPHRMGLTRFNIHWPIYARLVFVPLLICSAKGLYFTHDAFTVLFVGGLGFSNGYLGSLGILMVNETVAESERGVVGMFTGFFLNLGLVMGATLALGMDYFELI